MGTYFYNPASGNLEFPDQDGVSHRVAADLMFYDTNGQLASPFGGTSWFVDAIDGDDDHDGLSWAAPALTLGDTLTRLSSGDRVFIRGKVKEQLTAPARVFDVTLIGMGTGRPRHADASPIPIGRQSAMTWTTPDVATTAPLFKQKQQGWRYENILFAGPTDHACVELTRTAEGVSEQDSSHTTFFNCRFASGYNGISDTGGCRSIEFSRCTFEALSNFAILGVGNIGLGQTDWRIHDSKFAGFTNGVKIVAIKSYVERNFFTKGGTPNATVVLNLANGGGAADNFIVDNFFQGVTADFNTPDVVGTATDVWMRNYGLNTTAAGVGSSFEAGQPA